MKITNIKTFIYSTPYNRQEKWRFGIRKGTTSLLIKVETDEKIKTDENIYGLGETFCPISTMVIEKFIKEDLVNILRGENPLDINTIRNKLFYELGLDWVSDFGGVILAAVETALFDILGKKYNAPSYQFLGGKVKREVDFGEYIFSGSSDEMFDDLSILRERGIDAFKIKLGINEDEEYKFLEKTKSKYLNQVKIAVDVNQGWSRTDAIKNISKLEKYSILFIEQPLDKNDYEGSSWLRSRSNIPIALNEGIFSVQSMRKIIEKQAADYLVLDIISVGGVVSLMNIIKLADIYNIELISHSGGELEIATMMMVNIISTSEKFRYKNDTYAYYINDPIDKKINNELKTGKVSVKEWIGNGIDIDPIKLNKKNRIYSAFERD